MKPVSNSALRNSAERQSAASTPRLVRGPIAMVALERVAEPVERRVARRRVRDQLGDHRIVERS